MFNKTISIPQPQTLGAYIQAFLKEHQSLCYGFSIVWLVGLREHFESIRAIQVAHEDHRSQTFVPNTSYLPFLYLQALNMRESILPNLSAPIEISLENKLRELNTLADLIGVVIHLDKPLDHSMAFKIQRSDKPIYHCLDINNKDEDGNVYSQEIGTVSGLLQFIKEATQRLNYFEAINFKLITYRSTRPS